MQERRELKPPKALAIDPALLAEFRQLPDTRYGQRGRPWTPQEDELVLMFSPHKDKRSIAAKIGCHETTLRLRYRALATADPERAKRLAEEGRKLCSQ